MKIYKSKIDWWLMLIVFGAMGFPLVMGIVDGDYVMIIIFGIVLASILIMFRYTEYKLDGDKIMIWKTKIDINSIKRIEKTRSPLSSPALSLDRIEILYNKFDTILLSPKDRAGFIEELLKINPNIQVKI